MFFLLLAYFLFVRAGKGDAREKDASFLVFPVNLPIILKLFRRANDGEKRKRDS